MVVIDLAYNHNYSRVNYRRRSLLLYQDIQIPNTKAYYNLNGRFVFLEKKFESLYEDETALIAEHIKFVQRYLPKGYNVEFRKTYASVGELKNSLVEQCIILEVENKTYTLKSRLEKGKWIRSGELPEDAIRMWRKHFRDCLAR